MTFAIIETGDGRGLAYEEVGDPAGVPIFVIHGTPGSRLSNRHPDSSRVREAGLRVVSYDRPGYGCSTRHRGRCVVDCVSDVAAIADDLEIESFAVMGSSGGGPHALAVAARLPERVTRAACVVGPAPFDARGLDWLAGVDPVNVRETGWALAGEDTLAVEFEPRVLDCLDRIDDDPTALFRETQFSESDRAVLNDPGVREMLAAAIREAFAQGAWGWVDDDLAFVKPWGFDVQEVRVPTEIHYGAADVLVPPSHGEWLAAQIPQAAITIDEGAGHLRTPDQRLDVLRALASA